MILKNQSLIKEEVKMHYPQNTDLLTSLVFFGRVELSILYTQNISYLDQFVHKIDYCMYA